jgi:hypothetical protein
VQDQAYLAQVPDFDNHAEGTFNYCCTDEAAEQLHSSCGGAAGPTLHLICMVST